MGLNINKMIMEAMLTKSPELPVLKEIKAKFLVYMKSPEGVKTPLNDKIELELIKKIRNEHMETMMSVPTTSPLLKEELDAIDFLETFLPKAASIDEMTEFAKSIVEPGNKKGMGMYVKQMKEMFPSNDGKEIADIVKTLIG